MLEVVVLVGMGQAIRQEQAVLVEVETVQLLPLEAMQQ
jgi:hypothetical protein